MKIEGNDSGRVANVSTEFQLETVAESHSLQHHNSWVSENTYQAISIDTGITAKTQTLLHIINNDPARDIVITYIRAEAITNTASKPVVGEYFELGLGRTVSSGGTATTPVNMSAGSGKVASVTATGIDPTMAGTFTMIDRKYHEGNGKEWILNKEGALVVPLNSTVEMRFLSAGTGEAKCRMTFMMVDNSTR